VWFCVWGCDWGWGFEWFLECWDVVLVVADGSGFGFVGFCKFGLLGDFGWFLIWIVLVFFVCRYGCCLSIVVGLLFCDCFEYFDDGNGILFILFGGYGYCVDCLNCGIDD